jgi:hypothetical protein
MASMRSPLTHARRLPWTVADPPSEVFRNGTRPKSGQPTRLFWGARLLTTHGQQPLPASGGADVSATTNKQRSALAMLIKDAEAKIEQLRREQASRFAKSAS